MPKNETSIEEMPVEDRTRNISYFLKEKASPLGTIERVISDRFKDDKGKVIPFVIKAIPAARARDLERLSQKNIKSGNKVIGQETDTQRFMDQLIIESCEFPDFSDAELIRGYGARNPEHLLNTMLSLGERARLMQAVNEVNDLDNEPMGDLVDDAKD